MKLFKTKEERKIIKLAKQKAHEEYSKSVKREQAKKNFLDSPDDYNFYVELLRGLQINPLLKIVVEKSNGTKIIIKINEEEEKINRVSDWIDFNSITNTNNEARVK